MSVERASLFLAEHAPKLALVILVVAVLIFLLGPQDPVKAVVGTWVSSPMEIMGAQAHSFLIIKSDNTFEQGTVLGFPPRFYLADQVLGTWTATAGSITMMPVTCNTTDEPFGVLKATACKPATTMPINISGNVWTIPEEGGGKTRLRRK